MLLNYYTIIQQGLPGFQAINSYARRSD